ncbi:hypothetical protein ZOSMA_85G01250 [Zostera marina]|uniref:GDP-L-galactose phosphorylase n=1 Tax=Zostera marina TaxID=29655 RepID=A0A0K9NLA3_ZOSMR|nr:hypothetical protein ZOSMA_85G01250 [Zostera marina]
MVSLEHIESKCCLAKPKNNQMNPSHPHFRGKLSSIEVPVCKIGRISSESVLETDSKFSFNYEQSLLDSLLLAQWDKFSWNGLVKYDVTSCATKIVESDGGGGVFVVQLNENCNFDLFKENGNTNSSCEQHGISEKIFTEDILFCIKLEGMNDKPELILSAPIPNNSIMVILNETPVEYGHVFLLPHDGEFIELLDSAMNVSADINNSSLRIFYDSPASSSDLIYFEACHFANNLAVELMPTISVFDGLNDEGIGIFEILNYPLKTMMFACEKKNDFGFFIEVVSEICSCLLHQDVGFNLLISDSGRKVFLFFQVGISAKYRKLNALECGGHFVLSSFEDFNKIEEEEIMKCLAKVSLDDKSFKKVKKLSCDVAIGSTKNAALGLASEP